ncbi:hypothetical protein TNCV_2622551 [Trichonephila clavipes]|uniref:Uncharacterized protein n=1 Tax=Trichonephila clavipes TaxID=2585209 RepID=A0A8X7BI71_TRICX|nr:hypothetical protein TNCV_2622551 [Trichonephila clavipes]
MSSRFPANDNTPIFVFKAKPELIRNENTSSLIMRPVDMVTPANVPANGMQMAGRVDEEMIPQGTLFSKIPMLESGIPAQVSPDSGSKLRGSSLIAFEITINFKFYASAQTTENKDSAHSVRHQQLLESSLRQLSCGRSSQVVKVSDRCWHITSLSPLSQKIHRVRDLKPVDSSNVLPMVWCGN